MSAPLSSALSALHPSPPSIGPARDDGRHRVRLARSRPLDEVADRCLAFFVGAVGADALRRRGPRSSARRSLVASRVPLRAANPDADFIQQVITREKQDTDVESTPDPSKDFYAVLVHAEMGSCNMPFCAMPGISGIVCHCKKKGIAPPSGGGNRYIKSRDGKCALNMMEYAEVIAEGVAQAMNNPVGSTMVIGTFKTAAEEYRARLEGLGLWASIVPVARDS